MHKGSGAEHALKGNAIVFPQGEELLKPKRYPQENIAYQNAIILFTSSFHLIQALLQTFPFPIFPIFLMVCFPSGCPRVWFLLLSVPEAIRVEALLNAVKAAETATPAPPDVAIKSLKHLVVVDGTMLLSVRLVAKCKMQI